MARQHSACGPQLIATVRRFKKDGKQPAPRLFTFGSGPPCDHCNPNHPNGTTKTHRVHSTAHEARGEHDLLGRLQTSHTQGYSILLRSHVAGSPCMTLIDWMSARSRVHHSPSLSHLVYRDHPVLSKEKPPVREGTGKGGGGVGVLHLCSFLMEVPNGKTGF